MWISVVKLKLRWRATCRRVPRVAKPLTGIREVEREEVAAEESRPAHLRRRQIEVDEVRHVDAFDGAVPLAEVGGRGRHGAVRTLRGFGRAELAVRRVDRLAIRPERGLDEAGRDALALEDLEVWVAARHQRTTHGGQRAFEVTHDAAQPVAIGRARRGQRLSDLRRGDQAAEAVATNIARQGRVPGVRDRIERELVPVTTRTRRGAIRARTAGAARARVGRLGLRGRAAGGQGERQHERAAHRLTTRCCRRPS